MMSQESLPPSLLRYMRLRMPTVVATRSVLTVLKSLLVLYRLPEFLPVLQDRPFRSVTMQDSLTRALPRLMLPPTRMAVQTSWLSTPVRSRLARLPLDVSRLAVARLQLPLVTMLVLVMLEPL